MLDNKEVDAAAAGLPASLDSLRVDEADYKLGASTSQAAEHSTPPRKARSKLEESREGHGVDDENENENDASAASSSAPSPVTPAPSLRRDGSSRATRGNDDAPRLDDKAGGVVVKAENGRDGVEEPADDASPSSSASPPDGDDADHHDDDAPPPSSSPSSSQPPPPVVREPLLDPNEDRFTMYPIRHPDVFLMYKQAVASFWTVEEVDLSQDSRDWRERLTGHERRFVSHVLAFFAASDGIVLENLVRSFFGWWCCCSFFG